MALYMAMLIQKLGEIQHNGIQESAMVSLAISKQCIYGIYTNHLVTCTIHLGEMMSTEGLIDAHHSV